MHVRVVAGNNDAAPAERGGVTVRDD